MSSKTKSVLKTVFYSHIIIFLSYFGSMDSKEYYAMNIYGNTQGVGEKTKNLINIQNISSETEYITINKPQ